jgi:hypothetical protein
MPDLIKPLRVLLYEDNDGYASSFKMAAQKKRIISEQVNNVDDLIDRIKENPKKYHFIVLDAKAFNQEGALPGSESELNLIRIFREFEKIQNENQLLIHHCINTGFADIKLKMISSNIVPCKIFEKGNETLLFEYIISEYWKTDKAQIDFKFPQIFEFAAIYFSEADKELLYDLFEHDKYSSVQIADRVNNLASLRRIVEHLIDIIHVQYLGGIPTFSSSAKRVKEISDFLKSKRDIPPHIYNIVTGIRETANSYGSHTPEQAIHIRDYPNSEIISSYAKNLKSVFDWANSKLIK